MHIHMLYINLTKVQSKFYDILGRPKGGINTYRGKEECFHWALGDKMMP